MMSNTRPPFTANIWPGMLDAFWACGGEDRNGRISRTRVEARVAHMLAAFGESSLQEPPAQEIYNARQQECRIHSAVLPVLEVAHLKAPVLYI